ncbi:glycosyltransferase family 41 protein [Rhizoctonia solani 123E]|uniref:protein O-GlcNAc transferase n=1 Tax=Rhizoctonia solani 123E TaxID=1423351 RepID=A0A074SYK6_9AGAM|nr:glycosyltransferase family 41 protein [Rhizoctonia solani 123E]
MSRIPSRQAPTSPGALPLDTQYLTNIVRPAAPAAQPLAGHVPPAQARTQHSLPRAPSTSSTTTSVTSGSSGISTQMIPTDISHPSSFSSSENLQSPGPKLQQAQPGIARPAPFPLQGQGESPTRFQRSDPGKVPQVVQPKTGQSSAGVFVARRQTFPSEATSAFAKPRPFNLSQPPRGYRSGPRSTSGRTLWGREGLPVRLQDTRHAPGGSPLAAPLDVLPGPYQAQRLSGNGFQYPRPSVPIIRPTHQPIPGLSVVPTVPSALGHSISLQGVAGPLEPSAGFTHMPFDPAPISMQIPLNPLKSSLTREAMLAHALKLYENPGAGSLPSLGLTTQPLDPETSELECVDPMQIYSIELLPLLTSLRTLHPTHLPTALLLACVQYVLSDYEGSLRTNHEILALNPNYVEAMSNIATTLRAVGNLHDAELWWRRAVQLRPSYWDAIDSLIGILCNAHRNTDASIPPGADQSRLRQALDICDFVLKKLVPGSTVLSSLSTGLIQKGEIHRFQNIIHTSGNLKFLLAVSEDPNPEKEFSGLRDQFAAVELMLNARAHTENRTTSVYLTIHDLLLGLAVSALYVTGNLPSIPELEAAIKNNPSLDLPYHIHNTQQAVLNALTRNNVLPLVFIKPENIFSVMTYLFASTKGLFPGVVDEAGNLNLDAIPAVLPAGATNASRMTATVLLTVAKHIQEAARRGDTLPYPLPSNGHGAPFIRASLSSALLLYYCALALHPSASVCNNLGILLSTLAGERITCLVGPPDSATAQPTFEVLTGPLLARTYYHQGLILDPNHPHLLTNMGSLLKDEGNLDEAIRMYSRALEIKPDFDVALANIANATKDAGRTIESIEYYKRAVLANPYFPESIVGLANVLGSVCDWQGRGGLVLDLYLDVSGRIVVPNENQTDPRPPGFFDKLLEICDAQIVSGYYASSGIIASDRTLEQWMETIEACLGPLSKERRQRWETCLQKFYTPFNRADKGVYEAGAVVRLVEMLSRFLQRRWYVDMYGSGAYSIKGKARELDVSKYFRPKLPAAMVAPLALSILPFHTFTLPLSTRRIRIISHRNAIRTSYLALTQDWLPLHVYQPPPPPNGGKLKVAYISSDFNNHPLGHLMQSVFRFHNAERFEIYCYATTTSDGSIYRATIETTAHHFVDVSSWPTQAIVERIQSDGIHILINLNGYTKGARNDIFVVRPAPIIISIMGFAGTMASGWSDYLLADLQACSPLGSALEIWRMHQRSNGESSQMQDHFARSLEHDFDIDLDPESVSEDWMFSEKLILMPASPMFHTCFVTDHKQSFREDDKENALALHGRSPTNELIWKFEEIRRHKLRRSLFPDIPDDWIIYANFNQLYKVDPVVFNSWLRILNRAPKTILWLLRFPALAEGNLLRCAELWAGPEIAKRIRFTDVAPKEIHIQRCRVADLFLDTIDCNAHTVATDVLWGGTPIVTWPRYEHKMCSRIAASIAHATGYGRQMIVSSLSDYEDRAVDLAKSVSFIAASDEQGGWYRQCRGALSDLRRNLYLNRDTMPLFDTARWTRNVERAYTEAWRRWEVGTEFENSEEWLECSGEEKETSCIYVREE